MKSYFLKRTLELIPIFFVISFIIFMLLNAMPGDPLLQMRMDNPRAFAQDPERLAELREYYRLDDPLIVKYFDWLKNILIGDLGFSSQYKIPVSELIFSRLPNTLLLTVTAWVIGIVLALPIGIYAAVKKYSVFDYSTTVFAFVGISLPPFWFALMAIILFGVILQWLPISGIETYGIMGFWNVFVDRLKHLIMPAIVLGFIQVAFWVRYIHAALLEVLDQDYIRTAYAKGAKESRVIMRHALRNAMIPIITIIALDIPYFFVGALIVKTDFNLTYLFIAHDLSVVKHISDRIAVMYLGKIIELTQTDELFNNPLHPYSKGLLDSIPIPNPHKRKEGKQLLTGDVPSPVDPPQACRFVSRCPQAFDRCKREIPKLQEIQPGHEVACFLYD